MKNNHKKKIKKILIGLFAILAIAGLFVYFAVIKPEYDRLRVLAYDKLANMDRSDFSMLSDTEIYDKNGERIGLINAGHYEYVKIADISENLQNAYIAQEDRNFKIHHGVDYRAMLRAAIALVINRGEITQGGSTITQQLIKNTYLTQEKSFSRKFVELMLAPEVEKMYTKAEIMEFYCNTNFYGNHCYGVGAASRYYFGKDASELTVSEAAALVGISNAPSRYEPVGHMEACIEKRNQVLQSMAEVGYLTEEECKALSQTELKLVLEEQEGTDENYMSSYALHCAALTLMKRDHFAFEYVWEDESSYDAYIEKYDEAYQYYASELRNGGYQIYTSLDQEVQRIIQEQLDAGLESFEERQENGKYALQGAAVAVDNRSGYVVAVVGGRETEDAYNRAYLSVRQPGSAIKPLLDYGPAFDSGEYSPASIVNDYQWEGGPSNAGGYYGKVTIREALNRSLNTVAWQLLEDMGISYGLQYLEKMQFMKLSWVDSHAPSISIGGFTNGVRVVDMAKGFSTLANGGTYQEKTCIVQIVHEKEGDLTENQKPGVRQVYREDTAWMLTDILKGTISSEVGTGNGLALENGMPAAGKTGTTNDSKDTWFCGYSRYYTMAVWVGYDMPRAMPGVYGATYAGKIWKASMDRLHEGLEPLDWDRPETVVQRTDPETGITDWASSTDEIRAEAALRAKEQEKAEQEAESLLIQYEAHEIKTVEDVYTEQELYDKIKAQTDILDDNTVRSSLMERLLQRKSYFEEIEEEMKDTIQRYEEMKAEESRQAQSIAAEEAEKQREQTEREVNIQSFLQALEYLESLSYRPDHAVRLIQEAIDKLDYVEGYAEAAMYAERLKAAVERLNDLPSETVWKQQEAQRKASEQAAENAKINGLQETLREQLLPGAGNASSEGPGE